MPCGLPGFSSLFILRVIVMWQRLRANQIALFQECVVHPVFIFCLFFHKWSQKVWSTRFSFNSKNRADHSFFFMPYLSDLLPFMVIFERTLWRQSHPPAYHHQIVCILDIITNKYTFFFSRLNKKKLFFFRINKKKFFRLKKKKKLTSENFTFSIEIEIWNKKFKNYF